MTSVEAPVKPEAVKQAPVQPKASASDSAVVPSTPIAPVSPIRMPIATKPAPSVLAVGLALATMPLAMLQLGLTHSLGSMVADFTFTIMAAVLLAVTENIGADASKAAATKAVTA